MVTPLARIALQTTGNETAEGNGAVPRPDWVPTSIPIWVIEVLAAVLVLGIAYVVAQLLVRLSSRRLARYFDRPSLTRITLAGIRAGVYIFAFLTILRIFGLDLGNIALSVTVFTAVVGVILAPIVGSIISGMFLLADQPYEIGDMIEVSEQNQRGFVDDITLRYTKITTLDNNFLVVPNGAMRERDVINYSAEDTRMRLTLDVLITYESDLAAARRKMEESARSIEGVISGGPKIRVGSARYPAGPDCLIAEFGDHGILLRLRYWAKDPYRLHTVRSQVQEKVWTAFEGDDIEIAYPHSQHVFDDTSGELQVSLADEDASPRPRRSGHRNEGPEPTEDGEIE
jgi:small-conductance mechanosensitive channel